NAFLFVAAGDAHEKTEHFCDRRKGVGVIVVEAETEVGVGETGVERLGADETFASADAVARSRFRFAAQAVEASVEGVAHARVEVHVGGRGGVAGSGDVMLGK